MMDVERTRGPDAAGPVQANFYLGARESLDEPEPIRDTERGSHRSLVNVYLLKGRCDPSRMVIAYSP